MNDIITVICIGIGATAVMDIWLLLLRRMGVQTLNFAFIGRWVGHLLRGRFRHDAIARSEPIPAELALGWITHYAIGVAFAALLVALVGLDWTASPSLLPAVLLGMGTVAAPLLALGSRTSDSESPEANAIASHFLSPDSQRACASR